MKSTLKPFFEFDTQGATHDYQPLSGSTSKNTIWTDTVPSLKIFALFSLDLFSHVTQSYFDPQPL